MLRIVDSPCTGKTKVLLKHAKANNCTVICSSPGRMIEKAAQYGIGMVKCISYYEFLSSYKNSSIEPESFVIDEPEKLLEIMFSNGSRLAGYDMTV